MIVTLLGSATTAAYGAIYDKNTDSFTLIERPSGMEFSVARVGDTWTLTMENRVRVVITRGQKPFRDGDQFIFNVYHAQNLPLGIINLDLGTFDVTVAP